jgi:hypothetical protein
LEKEEEEKRGVEVVVQGEAGVEWERVG